MSILKFRPVVVRKATLRESKVFATSDSTCRVQDTVFDGRRKSSKPNSARLSQSSQNNVISVQLDQKKGDKEIAAIHEITETDQSNHENFNFDIVDLDPFEMADNVEPRNTQ